jgi:hypothetical protein
MLSVVMLSVVMLSAVMLNIIMLSAVMPNVIILSVLILSIIMLNVIMLSVVAPQKSFMRLPTGHLLHLSHLPRHLLLLLRFHFLRLFKDFDPEASGHSLACHHHL